MLVESVCQIWKTNPTSHILICTPSNDICNEIALRILNFIKPKDTVEILRLFATSQKHKVIAGTALYDISNYYGPNFKIVHSVTRQYRIVLATLATSGKLAMAKLDPFHFTHLFIDECQCAPEPLSIIPIAGKFSKLYTTSKYNR